ETNGAAPANIYAFSKAIMDNLAMREAKENPSWIIVGLRYFNVYGPRETHKGVPASMVYHLAQQMKAGQRPRIFKHGDQKRDFVYVKDVVDGSIRALEAKESGIYNLGSGQARSFNELVDALNKCLGTKFQPDYIENPHAHYQNFTEADLDRVRGALGYQPQFSLERGVADYVEWLDPEKAEPQSRLRQFAESFLGHLKFVPFLVDFAAQALVELNAPCVPFCDPPLDLTAIGSRSL